VQAVLETGDTGNRGTDKTNTAGIGQIINLAGIGGGSSQGASEVNIPGIGPFDIQSLTQANFTGPAQINVPGIGLITVSASGQVNVPGFGQFNVADLGWYQHQRPCKNVMCI